MNKVLLVAVVAVYALALTWSGPASAQEGENRAVPVEFFTCDYADDKGMRDLKKVIGKFNQWADKNDSDYSAWVLTPQFHSGVDFDIGWMGSWPDGNAFGASQDKWKADGSEIAEAFAEVVECETHELSSVVAINAPSGPPKDGVVLFIGCSLNEGKSHGDAFRAHKTMAARMKERGGDVSSWLFYPGLGAADSGYDYWQAMTFASYADLGAAMERYNNGGGWQVGQEVLGPVVNCSESTAWDTRLVRDSFSKK